MCSLGPDSTSEGMAEGDNKNKWESKQESGQWIRRVNAGGCRNFLGESLYSVCAAGSLLLTSSLKLVHGGIL